MSVSDSKQPARYDVSFDAEQAWFMNHLTGQIQVEDILQVMILIRSHPEFKLSIPAIWDLREADLSLIAAEQVYLFGESVRRLEHGKRPALIAMVTARDLDHGIVRQLMGTASWNPEAYNIFPTLELAFDWVAQGRQDLAG